MQSRRCEDGLVLSTVSCVAIERFMVHVPLSELGEEAKVGVTFRKARAVRRVGLIRPLLAPLEPLRRVCQLTGVLSSSTCEAGSSALRI